MADAAQPSKIPWWVSYWTGPTTTRSTLCQESCLFFLTAGAAIGAGAVYLWWRPVGMGVIVLPVAFGVLPLGLTVAGIWALAAASWISRHRAWDRVASRREREAYEESRSLMAKSLPLGLLLLAAGGVAGALVGWAWETEVGIPVGIAFGGLGGFVLGTFLAGIREGARSRVGESGDMKSRDAGPGAAPNGRVV